MSKLKGTYYYFRDFVDTNSFNYGKITIIKADDEKSAWDELAIRHKKEYGQISQSLENMYMFLEKQEID